MVCDTRNAIKQAVKLSVPNRKMGDRRPLTKRVQVLRQCSHRGVILFNGGSSRNRSSLIQGRSVTVD